MPIYEYKCRVCGHQFEKIQKFSDSPVRKCPSCGGSVEKLVSRSGFQLKGSGWYVTDYARKSGEGSSSGGSKDSGESSKPAESSGSAKPSKKSKSDSGSK